MCTRVCMHTGVCTCTWARAHLEDRGQLQVPFPRSCLPCVLRQCLSPARSETSPRKARPAAGQQSSENRLSPPAPQDEHYNWVAPHLAFLRVFWGLDSGPQMIFMSTSIRNHIHIGIYIYIYIQITYICI